MLAPSALIDLAERHSCEGFALTDHDTLAGQAEAREAAAGTRLKLVTGVEISVTWPVPDADGEPSDMRPITIHIVGLNVDPTDAILGAGLESIRAGRRERAARIAAELERAGVPDTLEAAYDLAVNPEMIGRTHFARVLAARGHASNVGHVFSRFLTPGKPGYVPHRWATLAQAIGWIRAAGGIAVLAHPGRYKLDTEQRRALFTTFVALGGRAVEVVTGSHEPRQYAEYAALARQYGLLASRGADYHGPGESRFEPGTLPPLPAGLSPVWDAF
jgi:hypothetical protein